MCPEVWHWSSNGVVQPFCIKHEEEFKTSPEGTNRTWAGTLRPTSRSDFRNRMWREECARRNQAKWNDVTPEQREERKGGFGR